MNSQFRSRRDRRKAGDFSKITSIFDEDELNKLDIKLDNERDLDEDIDIEVNEELGQEKLESPIEDINKGISILFVNIKNSS